MPNDRDYQTYKAFLDERAREKRERGNRDLVAKGEKARTVVEHPGWQAFVEQIESLMGAAETKRDGALVQLTASKDENVLGPRFEIAEANAALGALATVLALIPTTLKKAEQAVEELRA